MADKRTIEEKMQMGKYKPFLSENRRGQNIPKPVRMTLDEYVQPGSYLARMKEAIPDTYGVDAQAQAGRSFIRRIPYEPLTPGPESEVEMAAESTPNVSSSRQEIPTVAQIGTSDGPYEKVGMGNVTTLSGPSGSMNYEGPARSGGSFTVDPGGSRASFSSRGGLSDEQWNALPQEERTKIRVDAINKDIAEMKAGQGPQVSNQQGPQLASFGQQTAQGGYTGPGGSWQSADVQARNRRMTIENAIDDRRRVMKNAVANAPAGRDRNAARRAEAANYRTDVGAMLDMVKQGSQGAAGPSLSDQIALARLGLDQQKMGLNAQVEASKLLQGQQKEANLQRQRNYENRLEQANSNRERAAILTEGITEARKTYELPPGSDRLLYGIAGSTNMHPDLVGAEIQNAYLSNPEYKDIFESDDTTLKTNALREIQATVLRQLGISQ